MSEQETTNSNPSGQEETRIPREPVYIEPELENELLIAVMPHRFTPGVHEPGAVTVVDSKAEKKVYKSFTYDWRYPRFCEENTKGTTDALTVDTVMNQMTKKWQSEAMAVRYLLRGPNGRLLKRIPRISKDAECISWFESLGYTIVMRTILVDVDTPGHKDLTPEDIAEFHRLEQNRPPSLRDAGMYLTGRGWRVVQPMLEDVPVDQAEDVIRGYMLWLEQDGIMTDWACKDWPHIFRVPRTYRPEKGKRADSDFLVRP